ncbi:YadA-like family protein [Burkholderia lata]|uniref:YadA-like family protein n=1 Tax=Burkholderia lata (strain ATCC 17760 / DSM 23089 / LMG 22485 / NCIMB 9086 / R18194 / 383) TaxID=482957 RepID=UPI003F68A2C8
MGNATTQRRIVNVADGMANTDAVNVGQMNTALATKVDNTYFKVNSAAGAARADTINSIAIGPNAIVNTGGVGGANSSIAIGNGAVAGGTDTIMIGTSASHSGSAATVVGSNASAGGGGAGVALGARSSAAGNAAVALGTGTTASGRNSVALGNDSVANADNTVSVGSATAQRRIANMAAGTAATDAVNVSQLTGVTNALGGGAGVGANGTVTQPTYTVAGKNYNNVGDALDALAASGGDADSVKYDDGTHRAVTLGNVGAPVTIRNVATGELSATSTDAVNGSQLFATNTRVGDLEGSLKDGGVIDPVTGKSLAVTYDSATKDKATLAGADGTTLSNVKAGVADMDAVNVSQLKDSGLIGDDGKAIAAVTYDDASKASVTLGNAGTPVAIRNVADGELSATSKDAVNGSQLFATNTRVGDLEGSLKDGGVIDPVTGKSLAVTYDSVTKDKATLAGADGTTLSNVKAGTADMDAVNVSQLKGSGLIGDDGKTIAAVTYDRNADGTPNFNSVTMGGGNATGPVTISNVAAGVAGTDAVNVQQMRDAAANGNPYIGGRGTGVAAQATGINAVALGLGSLANEINTISVGNSTTGLQRRITNVQNGQADSDAATVGQVNDLIGVASTNTQASIDDINAKTKDAIQSVNDRLDTIGTTVSSNPYVQVDGAGDGSDNAFAGAGTYGVAVGAEASATGTTAIAVGAQAVSSGTGSVALGAGASATANGAVAFGSGRATGTSALALGNGTVATGNNAVAAGFNAQADGLNALAVGNTARANANDSMAFGTTAQVDALATNAIAIGRQANVTSAGQNAVALGAGSVADRLNSISVGSAGAERQVIYVARGTSNTDAVNVSQLRDAIAAFGGNASVDANGSIVNPTYTINGTQYRTVGQALDALAQLGGGTDPLAVTYGKDEDGNPNFEVVSLKGAGGTTLSNVKAGVADMDAVNVSQLKGSGLIGDDGKAIAAVTYDRHADGTPDYSKVTLGNGEGPTQLKNVANATDDGDALNLGQLKEAGLIGDDGAGNLTSAAVTYDRHADGTINHEQITLQGTDGTTITNVKAGELSETSTDAVNGSQLFATNTRVGDLEGSLKDGGVIDPVTGKSLAVVYDGTAKDTVTLAGADGTTLSNVKAGIADMDAVNVSQLKGSGLIGDDGKAIAAVTYDRNADGTPNYGSVTFGGGHATDPVVLSNVAQGVAGTDAVNVDQLTKAIKDVEGGTNPLAVSYDTVAQNSVTLKGADGTTLSNVKAGVADMDAVNVSQLKGSGLIGDDGKSIAAVTYDRLADGTPDYGKVTLGNGEGPTQIKNVANATDDGDALNLGQLKEAGLIGDDGAGNLTSAAVTYDRNADGTINHDQITLQGADGTTITNVKAGDLSATSTDAVNGSQLFATNTRVGDLEGSLKDGGVIDPVTGKSLAVTYDGVGQDKVTLKGADGTTLSNVRAGIADMDAVNVSQLKGSGLIGDDGKSVAAVTYDRHADGTPNYGTVTLGHGEGPTQIKNVANATDDGDALNLGQLKEAGLIGDDGAGNLTSAAVTYDRNADGTINHDQITLQGTDGTTITNVKAGELSATSTDAVNGSQLFATNTRVGDLEGSLKDGGVIDPVTGKSLAVVYDGTAKDTVTLKGVDGTTLSNVKAGIADMDAVNVSQLKGSGLIGDDGKSIAAVTYDRLADGTPNYGSVTLGHGAGPTQLKNVAAATDNTDAVNFGQMKDYVGDYLGDPSLPGNPLAVAYDDSTKGQVTLAGADGTTITNVKAGEVSTTSTDAINGAQLHATAQSVADSLGGGSTIDTDGKVTNPTYSLADPADGSTKTEYHNVGDALANLDGRTSTNTENITVINKQLADSGLVDPVTGQSIAAVTYDRNADGTPNLGSVTLGGADATVPVALKNVADGTDRHDAINLGQLQDAGLVAPVDPTDPEKGLKSLAVTYDGVDQDKVTLKGADGTTLANVKAGVADMDAVNVSQLKGSGLIGDDGKAIAAVTYDRHADGTPNYGSVTLGHGEGPTQIKNVANATDDGDALNLGQLKEAGLIGDDGAGNLTSAAVTYDRNADGTINHDKATLAGADGTTLSNVKAGVADMDAVNVSQLKGSGLIGDDGKAIAAVTYDRHADGTPDYGKVTLGNGEGPTQIKNVANATDDGDALNLGQLKEAGLVGDDGSGNLTSLAVTYDDAEKNAITLGGTGATTPAAIHNVADGVLSATSKDAVNGSQLFATNTRVGDLENSLKDGGVIDPITGRSLAVTYDGTAKDTVTLQGADGTTLANVKAGVADMDAVNVRQLKDSGLIGDDGKAIAAVTYDDATKSTVTLGGTGSTTPVTLKNVADGVDRHDAINLGQLQDAGLVAPVDPTNPGAGLTSTAVTYDRNADDSVNFGQITLKGGADGTKLSNVAAGEVSATSQDAINGSQLHATAQSVSDSLGGGSTVDADGKVTNPTYSLADPTDGSTKTEYHNVGDALANLDGRTSTNTENITVINKQLGDSGLVDPVTGQTLAAVTYDRNADGTPNRGSVTLGGTDATAPVALKNVADGVDANDAVNVGQLQAAGIVAPVDPENPGKGLKSLAVTYDGVDQDKVTLKGTDGTTLTNVKAGAVTATSTDAINGAQLHATAQSVSDSLGGGSTVDAEGKVTSPTYSLADPTDGSTKTEYHNVGDALANLDGRTSTNTENITVINKQLGDSGLIDPVTGQSIAAVTYDRNADGTPNRGSVTLGGADATAPVALKNVADGTDRHDAINLGQLQDAGLVAPVDPANPGTGLTSLAVTYDKHADGSANFDQISLKGENGTTITNVKAGAVSATSTDAVNGSQLYGASQSVAKALGGGATVDANGNVTNPTYTVNNEKFDNVGDALDNISSSLVNGSIGLVRQDETTRDITVAKDTDGTTVNFAGTVGDRVLTGVAAGAVNATSNDAINGSQLHGTAQSVADTIGGGTTVDADGKLADTSIEVNGSKYKTVAEAVQAAAAYGATDSLAVRYDLNGDGTPNFGSVTLGGTGAAPVRLTNVADGTTQYDAVNFGQLSELSDKIGGIDDRVGRLEENPGGGGGTPPGGGSGGSDYFAGTDIGSGTTPANAGDGVGNTAAGSGAVVGTGVNNGTAIGSSSNVSGSNGTAIGSSAQSSAEGATAIGSNANASGSKSAAIGDGANASGSNSVALGAGSVATSDNTVSVGSATQQRTISNLADGVNATDAATKGQLDRAMGGMQGQMNELSRNAYSGIAAATALTMIPGVDPGKTLSFGIGGATFQGYQAVAFGGEARITQNLKMKAGVGLSSGGNTVGVGASYQW